jgi:hypothetical protein
VLLIVAPPLLLAALISLGYWVVRGFRSDGRRSGIDPYPGP